MQGLPGHPELGRHQHGAMALLDSGQFHQEPIPAYVMWRTAVVATGERGEHDKGTKPADTHPHHHAGADRFTSGNSTGGRIRVRRKHLVSQRGSQNMQSARHAAEVKSRCGGPPTASTPTTHDQPEQDSCRQLRRSGNTTSTEVSPAAATTTTAILTSKSASLLEPHVIAGTKIDSGCPNHPRSTRTRHPAPAYRSPA